MALSREAETADFSRREPLHRDRRRPWHAILGERWQETNRRLGSDPHDPGNADRAFTWTNPAGRKIEARFVRLEENYVILNIDGKIVTVPFNKLSPASIEQARTLEKRRTVP